MKYIGIIKWVLFFAITSSFVYTSINAVNILFDSKSEYIIPENAAGSVITKDGNSLYIDSEELEMVTHTWEELLAMLQERVVNQKVIAFGANAAILLLFMKNISLPRLPVKVFKKLRRKFESKRIKENISIKEAPYGLIAVREWRITKDGFLKSISAGEIWESETLYADEIPEADSSHGIYAHRLGFMTYEYGQVAGICSMSGRIIGHSDNVIRVEKCEIIALVVKDNYKKKKLEQNYNVPIFVNFKPGREIIRWSASREGLFWQMLNNNVIDKGRISRYKSSIEEIPALQEF